MALPEVITLSCWVWLGVLVALSLSMASAADNLVVATASNIAQARGLEPAARVYELRVRNATSTQATVAPAEESANTDASEVSTPQEDTSAVRFDSVTVDNTVPEDTNHKANTSAAARAASLNGNASSEGSAKVESSLNREDTPKVKTTTIRQDTPKTEANSQRVDKLKLTTTPLADISPAANTPPPLVEIKPLRPDNPHLNEYKTPGHVAAPSAKHDTTPARLAPTPGAFDNSVHPSEPANADLTPSRDSPKNAEVGPIPSRTPPKTAEAASNEAKHPCARECVAGGPAMTCRYRFVLEDYHAMSKACYACASNATDCARPDCVAVDGVPRSLVVVNRQLPGPSVEVCLGDRVVVDVDNRLLEASTSVHWHGHHQRGTPFMDGVPYVTQCPVPPKSAFRYRYVADTPGTHFWHSHSGCQRADGAFGAFVVRVPRTQAAHAPLYDADMRAHTLQLLDWTHVGGAAKFLEHHHAAGDNKPDTILVNGKGRWRGGHPDVVDVDRLASFHVQQGVRYRFRLINAGFLNCPMQLSIDNHTLTVIASDGSDLRPVEAESLVSYAGERWDFVLSAQAPVGSYWMRVRGLMDCDERFKSAHQLAVLRYEGAAHEQPKGPTGYEDARRQGLSVNALNVAASDADSLVVSELEAIVADDASMLQETADLTFYLAYDFYPLDNPTYNRAPLYGFHQVADKKQRLYTPQLNHVTMRLPRAPPLSQPDALDPRSVCRLDGAGVGAEPHAAARNCSAELCSCTHVLHVPLGAVVELVLVDEGVTFDANHPFHLHGYAFRVVGTDRLGSTTSADEVRALDRTGKIARKLHNAPLKDTVTVPDGGFTIVRFLANNPGFWLFHCHIEFHVEVGMAVVFQVGEQGDVPPVPVGFPRCGDFLPVDAYHDDFDDQDQDHDQVQVEVVPLSGSKHERPRATVHAARGGSAHAARAVWSLLCAALLLLLLRLRST